MSHCFINCKLGFVRDAYVEEPVIKARFTSDVREAKPFGNLGEAHKFWSKTVYADWYYCVLWPD